LKIENSEEEMPLEEMHLRTIAKTGNFASKLIQCEKYSYHGFEVLFDEKVILAKNTRYSLWADISGPDSLCGRDGLRFVNCGDITIRFFPSSYYDFDDEYSNISTVHVGQFPEFLIA